MMLFYFLKTSDVLQCQSFYWALKLLFFWIKVSHLWSSEMWHTTGDEHRSHWTRLPGDTSAMTYRHRDARYAPPTRDRVIQNTFINPGQHPHVNLTSVIAPWSLLLNVIYYYLYWIGPSEAQTFQPQSLHQVSKEKQKPLCNL